MPPIEPSHSDILVQLGELKGQVSTLIMLMGQKREDINAVFLRLGVLEKDTATHGDMDRISARVGVMEREMAKWAGICIAVATLMPVVMPQLQRVMGVTDRPSLPQPTIPHRGLP